MLAHFSDDVAGICPGILHAASSSANFAVEQEAYPVVVRTPGQPVMTFFQLSGRLLH